MTDETTGGDLRLRPPAEALDPRVRRLWRAWIAISTVVAVAIAVVGVVIAAAVADPPAGLLAAVVAVVAVGGVVVAVVAPPIAYRVIRFEVTPLGLFVRTGWITETLTVVPHSRIQSVRTTTDPLQRSLGLATVEVRTAGSAVARIPGLDAGRVAALRSELAAMAGTGTAT
ncbi:PH domain-containing protein [Miltoncostaea oceani]|uniref:PH domain-containing protein n=1 Tax=Miltoncostaea oceani TaxID=2843216 RepID=UPI001C3D770A|nr:PH domain-containing protein [Miltoncostaea oceani]